mgnify:CR=1 FL=1
MKRYMFFYLFPVLLACSSRQDNADADGPFAPPVRTSAQFLLRSGYEHIAENSDVAVLRKTVSDSLIFYFQFGESLDDGPEVFISEIVLPGSFNDKRALLSRYKVNVISDTTVIDSRTIAFYMKSNVNETFYKCFVTVRDTASILQNNYFMPHFSQILNRESNRDK